MNVKQAIYLLMKRFRGADSNLQQTALSGTSATITVPKDCWLTVNGTADNGISLAPTMFLVIGDNILANTAGVAYQGTNISASAYVKKGTVITVEAYRCKLTSYNIFGGGVYNPCNFNAFSIREGVLAA